MTEIRSCLKLCVGVVAILEMLSTKTGVIFFDIAFETLKLTLHVKYIEGTVYKHWLALT